jgi:chorismate dehydratase
VEKPGKTVKSVRVGAVSYLNTKPLVTYLGHRLPAASRIELDLPSRLADRLQTGELDLALIPIVEYLRSCEATGYRIFSDACIACLGPVHSVRVFFRKPPIDVRTLAVDEGSRTSIALSCCLFHSRFGRIPELSPLAIDADPQKSEVDAVLVIGDRAMHPEEYHGFVENWDLGEEWYRETSLPFVFAVWAGREEEVDSTVAEALELARDEGVASIQRLAERFASTYRLSVPACRDYLGRHLRFTLTSEALHGAKLFYRQALSLGLVELIDENLRFEPISRNSTRLIPCG